METFLSYLASFFAGCLVAVFGFVLPFNGRMTKLETNQDNFGKKLDDHIKAVPPQCPYHVKLESDVAVVKSKLDLPD